MKKTLQKLQEANILVEVLSTLPHLVSYLDANLTYRFVNPAYSKWFGEPLEFFLFRPIREIIGEAAFTTIECYLRRALQGERVSFDIEIPYRKGPTRMAHVEYTPHHSPEGEVLGFIAIIQDISDSYRKAALLKESEQRLRYALEATGEGVWDWKIPEGIVYHNPQWCRLLGLDDKYLEHPLEQFSSRIHPSDKPQVMERLQKCLDGYDAYDSEHRLQKSDGSYLWVHDRGHVVERDSNNKPTRMAGSFRDITQLRAAHELLLQSSKMSSLGEMAGGVAHEINNPLMVIHGKAFQLARQLESPELDREKMKADIQKIAATTDRIAKIVKGLRTFSRNSERDPMESVSIVNIIDETLALCRERFKHSCIATTLSGDTNVILECRPTQISQVLMNLLSNAFDAIENLAEKWIQISVSTQGDTVKIVITDSGKGIPPEIAERIMHPFFSTKEVGKGTGLGLSVSQGIVSSHNGKLYYDKNSSHTRFVVELPLRHQEQQAA